MEVLWMVGTVLGVMVLLFLYEVTCLLLVHCLVKREEYRLQKVLKKSLDYFQSPEYKRLREETFEEMVSDDLYKTIH